MLKYLFMLIFLIVSPLVMAWEWSGRTSISLIYPHSTNNSDGTIYLTFKKMINPSNCRSSAHIALKKSNKLDQEIYSLLLAARAMKSEVNYYAGGCDSHGYPVLLHIQL